MTEYKEDSKLHPRNKHRNSYDFVALIASSPELSNFVITNKYGNKSINFFDSMAVKSLNRALLIHYYNIEYWNIPEGYLCPPIPGRADYIHNIADLLTISGEIPKGRNIKVLDIGIGANCIYPIIGQHEYDWAFTGTDIDPVAAKSARKIISANVALKDQIDVRIQKNAEKIFQGVIQEDDFFDVCICNPPFHASAEEASKGNLRKIRGISKSKIASPSLNFGGKNNELWCAGGELAFISQMIRESSSYAAKIKWFTTLVSKESNLSPLIKALHKTTARGIKFINMGQGNKVSRILVWTFL